MKRVFALFKESILCFQAPLLVNIKQKLDFVYSFFRIIYTGAPGNRHSIHKYKIQSINSMFVQVSILKYSTDAIDVIDVSPYKGCQPVFLQDS